MIRLRMPARRQDEGCIRFLFEHDLFRPANARRSIGSHDQDLPGLRAGGKPVPTSDQVQDRLFGIMLQADRFM
jgi:hypothetical protein